MSALPFLQVDTDYSGGLTFVFAGDNHYIIVFLMLSFAIVASYRTSGAREMIFI